MEKVFFATLLLMLAFNSPEIQAANIYIDTNPGADCFGNYSIASRNCSGSDGDSYQDLQDALNNMTGGDDIFLRGGIHTRASSEPNAVWEIQLGTDGTANNYSSIQSYPGEWAVLDGENRVCSNCGSRSVTLGVFNESDFDSSKDRAYWLIERLEITGGVTESGGAGIWINGGPFTVRYCYIHSNKQTLGTSNNPAGIKSYHPRQCIIEYNWFYDNGGTNGSTNQAQIAFATDYNYCFDGEVGGSPRTTQSFVSNEACTRNIVRYNYFDTSYVGFKHKSSQYLTSKSPISMAYKGYGDIIHHNIFVNHNHSGPFVKIDFAQVYNNIVDGSALIMNESGSGSQEKVWMVAYNNTVKSDALWNAVGYSDDHCGVAYPIVDYAPTYFCVNNIVDSFVNVWDHSSITVGYRMASVGGSLTVANLTIDRNLVYKSSGAERSGGHFTVGKTYASAYAGDFTATAFNTQYGTINWSSSTNGLFVGAFGTDRYKTTTFDLGGGANTDTGGIGGAHPYLTGVTIPDYVGAVNPNDDLWVDGVANNLTNTTWLRSTSTDRDENDIPTWIEGTSPASGSPNINGAGFVGITIQ